MSTTSRTSGRESVHSMPLEHDTLVVVQREWTDWRTAMAHVADLEDVHWFQPSGAPRPLIHAYVNCSKFLSGEVPHDCRATPAPHRVLVCLLKRHLAEYTFEQLSHRADARRGTTK